MVLKLFPHQVGQTRGAVWSARVAGCILCEDWGLCDLGGIFVALREIKLPTEKTIQAESKQRTAGMGRKELTLSGVLKGDAGAHCAVICGVI